MTGDPVAVLGATGPVGRALVERLQTSGVQVRAIGRDPARLASLAGVDETRIADFADPPALAAALAGASRVAMTANARHLPAVLDALPTAGIERLVVMGSTRFFSAVPDDTATAVRAAWDRLRIVPFPATLLLATMIHGTGRGVVPGLARLIGQGRPIPLPGYGKPRIQPIHVGDVARSLAAALERPAVASAPIVIAGAEPLAYRAMVKRIGAAIGRRPLVLPLPAWPVWAAAPILPRAIVGSLLRRLEDQTFDLAAMRALLGVDPAGFAVDPRDLDRPF